MSICDQRGSFLCSDNKLNQIFDAARLALVLNTFDVFMDYPGRERGGWSMDSFGLHVLLVCCLQTMEWSDMLENYLSESRQSIQSLFLHVILEHSCRITTGRFSGIAIADYYKRTAIYLC